MNLAKGGLLVAAGFFILGNILPIRGATTRDDQPDSDYVALGALADFDAVGLLNAGAFTGCGILIASDWVLTAAHLLDFVSSATFTINGTSYDSAQVYRHPSWTGSSNNGYDFGLVHLNSSLAAIPPAMFYSGSSESGQVGTFVGYGFHGTGVTGWISPADGQKRAFQNMIDGNFGNPSLVLGCDFDNPHNAADNGFGSATPLTLEGCVAPGDSGGGVFIQQGSQYFLTGVISFNANVDGTQNSDYGDASGFGRVSAALPWINSVMNVPEPSSIALLLTSGMALLCFKRRNK